MITKTPYRGNTHTIQVTFSLPATLWAATIALVGNFNAGNSMTTQLHQSEREWHTTLDLPIHQIYQYRFLLNDTQWVSDWNGDGFGTDAHGRNISIVTT